jgi:hypothetical protein
MARVHGRKGRVYIGIASDTAAAESLPYTATWSISFATDNAEVTALGDTGKVYVAGLPDVSGSFSGFLDDATAQTYTAAADGLARRFYMYPSTPSLTGPYWFGTVLADYTAEGDVGDAVKMSGDWSAASAVAKIG